MSEKGIVLYPNDSLHLQQQITTMQPSLYYSTISYTDFQHQLTSYPKHIPPALQDSLSELRYDTIPAVLAERKAKPKPKSNSKSKTETENATAVLEKTELISLMEWKLKHGTYRPRLAALVAQNRVADVREASREAFEMYEEAGPGKGEGHMAGTKRLAKLKGVGPATASLVLACYDPVRVPFFSDELFRYVHYSEGKGQGWDRKIGYTMKEYGRVFERVQALRQRLEEESGEGVKAVEVEKVAYALAKGAQQSGDSGSSVAQKRELEENEKPLQPPSPKRRKKKT